MAIEPTLEEKIKAAPESPGCYLYKDKAGHIIYVGKAKMLRNRVRSYFRATEDEKVQRLVRQIADVEYFTTETETDALLHEYRLIKQHKPWFNSQLKRDTPHPLIRLDKNGRYATLSLTQQREEDDGVRYFDCFHDEQDAKDTLVLLNKVWGVPACGQPDFSQAKRACLNYHLGACMAPCEGKANEERYAWAIADIVRLFDGKRVSRIPQLEREMQDAAEAMEYEKAGQIKELLGDLGRFQRKARRMFNYPAGRSVLVFLRAWRENEHSLFLVHDGAVLAQGRFSAVLDETALSHFLANASAQLEPGPPWLADAVREIYADKLFVLLPARYGQTRLEKDIRKYHAAFCR